MGTHKKFIPKKKEEAYDPYKTYDDSMLMGTEEDEQDKPHYDIPVFEPNQTVLHKEMLQSNTSELRDLKFSNEYIDFGFAHHGALSVDR